MRVAILTGAAETEAASEAASELTRAGDDVRLIDSRRPPDILVGRRSYEPELTVVPGVIRRLRASDAEIAHSFSHVLAWATLRFTRLPVVFTCTAVVDRLYLVSARSRLAMMERVAREAAAIAVPDDARADAFERFLQRRPEVVSGVEALRRLYTQACPES